MSRMDTVICPSCGSLLTLSETTDEDLAQLTPPDVARLIAHGLPDCGTRSLEKDSEVKGDEKLLGSLVQENFSPGEEMLLDELEKARLLHFPGGEK